MSLMLRFVKGTGWAVYSFNAKKSVKVIGLCDRSEAARRVAFAYPNAKIKFAK